ncbi:hypothetical protein F5Y16DRAFT_400554 [Xylariaceae sp. FL0255]|nr:hypothetical protein F5Y16DRAFT_400554 [Xylariaceae sp. FL0255]
MEAYEAHGVPTRPMEAYEAHGVPASVWKCALHTHFQALPGTPRHFQALPGLMGLYTHFQAIPGLMGLHTHFQALAGTPWASHAFMGLACLHGPRRHSEAPAGLKPHKIEACSQ